jgi:hypothetical protein
MAEISCKQNDVESYPVWGVLNFSMWYFMPERIGGGKPYIQKFKGAWVMHNKAAIKAAAAKYRMPAELLAGVCWIEVGGDPNVVDGVAFTVRSFDWSGPPVIDKMTITKHPALTSFGAVSMQLRTAAETMGLDAKKMTADQLKSLANCLQQDAYNIDLVAMHLRQIIDHDGLQKAPPSLDPEAVKVAGARYNRGLGLSLDAIKKNTKYGNFIAHNWSVFATLLQ